MAAKTGKHNLPPGAKVARNAGTARRRLSKSGPIVLPHAWNPYPWQADVLAAMQRGVKRFLLVVHRRAGKDQVALNMAAIASQQRIGQFWHILPEKEQVKTHIWKGIDENTGVSFIDQAFPHAMRLKTLENAAEIHFNNGSIWKCMGSDNYQSLRGGNPIGVFFSEAAFAVPDAWSNMAPILRRNNGIVCFISTPWGQNWFYKLYQAVKDHPEWYVRHLTVEDTFDWQGRPLFSQEQIQAERDEGKDEAEIQREYYCDFNANLAGAYYQLQLAKMRKEGRITTVDYDPKRPVFCAWDLGFSDLLVALMFQKNGNAHYCIGSRAWQYSEFEDALGELAVVFPWSIEKHFVPHDISSKTTRHMVTAAFEKYGEVEIIEKGSVHAGIQCVREMMATLWIDDAKRDWAPAGNNSELIQAIGTYRSRPTKTGAASSTPVHDWSSHYCDALRYYALGAAGGMVGPTQWGPSPNYDVMDRIARVIA